jgi:hypothetical protein
MVIVKLIKRIYCILTDHDDIAWQNEDDDSSLWYSECQRCGFTAKWIEEW